jgi:hypothetical protein
LGELRLRHLRQPREALACCRAAADLLKARGLPASSQLADLTARCMAEIATVEGEALPDTADAIQRAIDTLDKEFKDSECPFE